MQLWLFCCSFERKESDFNSPSDVSVCFQLRGNCLISFFTTVGDPTDHFVSQVLFSVPRNCFTLIFTHSLSPWNWQFPFMCPFFSRFDREQRFASSKTLLMCIAFTSIYNQVFWKKVHFISNCLISKTSNSLWICVNCVVYGQVDLRQEKRLLSSYMCVLIIQLGKP